MKRNISKHVGTLGNFDKRMEILGLNGAAIVRFLGFEGQVSMDNKVEESHVIQSQKAGLGERRGTAAG